jgi:hypothetical protein
VAVAVNVIVAATEALFDGFVIFTTGGVVSATTVKARPLLAAPPTVITTLPVEAAAGTEAITLVALQLLGVAVVPLNLTVLVPCVAPKLTPVMVTEEPTSPDAGFRVEMLGAGTVTVKLTPLLATPPTTTTTLPVTDPFGTVVVMLVALQLAAVAAVPLNFTALLPCVVPKLAPVIVTEAPTSPDAGLRLVRLGAGAVTVKLTPLLAAPPTVTMTLPVVAPAGTATTTFVVLQLVGAAAIPLKDTELVPCADPKFAPLSVTDAPTRPDVGFRLVMLGPGTVTVKLTPLLATPPTVTTTLPVVAPAGTGTTTLEAVQFVGVAPIPLKFTALLPWVDPKLAPVIVTEAPINPDVGFRLAMLGAGTGTVKLTPLLAVLPTVTTTLPVVAPDGTATTTLVALQVVGVAVVPLNLTVLAACVAPRFTPEMVTEAPTAPDVGFRLVMLGAASVLLTLTVTAALVVAFPEVSAATAVRV